MEYQVLRLNIKSAEDFEQVLNERAAEGWRVHTIVMLHPGAREIDFERSPRLSRQMR